MNGRTDRHPGSETMLAPARPSRFSSHSLQHPALHSWVCNGSLTGIRQPRLGGMHPHRTAHRQPSATVALAVVPVRAPKRTRIWSMSRSLLRLLPSGQVSLTSRPSAVSPARSAGELTHQGRKLNVSGGWMYITSRDQHGEFYLWDHEC
jgi:hypothetical protein